MELLNLALQELLLRLLRQCALRPFETKRRRKQLTHCCGRSLPKQRHLCRHSS